MSNERFRINGVRVGSAARSAEAEAAQSPAAQPLRVRAGSSARLAEDAKRYGEDLGSTTAGFSLRAGGGRVVRREEMSSPAQQRAAAERTPAEPRSASQVSTAAPVASATAASPEPPAATSGSGANLRAVPLQSTAGRLQSMFRALFKPGEPSPK